MRAVVLGGGTWGTGFSRLLADRGYEVTLAVRDAEDARAIAETGRNPHYSSSVDLNGIVATTIAEAPVDDDRSDRRRRAEPRVSLRGRGAARRARRCSSLTKGLDPETGERLSTLVRGRPVAVLSGPNMAEEVVAGLPGATVIASEDEHARGAAAGARSTRSSSASTSTTI